MFLVVIDYGLQGLINFKIKIYPILRLWVCPRDKSPLIEGFPNLDQKCILVQLGSLLILGLIDLDLRLYF